MLYFIGINRNATVSTTDNIDLSVKSHAEKGAEGSTWISPSDRRLKTGIRPFTDGLDVVRRMEPLWYSYNGTLGLESERPEVGIIAQDVREVAPYMVSGSEGESSYLTYNANALFYLLVNAVKEQQQAIEQLQAENRQLREDFGQRLADLEEILQGDPVASGNVGSNARQTVTLQGQNADAPVLYQNIPNPFSGETLVRYYVPASATTAELMVSAAATGAVIERVPLAHSGPGEVALRTERLAAGTYTYTLVIDGQPVATLQMLLNH
jgi:trimeric autotransporter adhesin